MGILRQPLEQSLDGISHVITSGKGGVGKSTISAALALRFADRANNVLAIDLDGSPSTSDALGGSDALRESLLVKNEIYAATKHIRVLMLSTLVPDLPEDCLEDREQFNEELLRLTARLLPPELQGQKSFLPILRLALQALSWGVPGDGKDLAHIIQLAEIAERNRVVISDFTSGNESVRTEPLGKVHTMILDTENMNNFLRLLKNLRRLVTMLERMQDQLSSYNPLSPTKVVAKVYPNFKQYTQSPIARQPDEFTSATRTLRDKLLGKDTALVAVTNPGSTEIRKALADVLGAAKAGKPISHILMNKFPGPGRKAERREAEKIEEHFLEKLADALDVLAKELGTELSVGYSRVEPEGYLPLSPSDPDYAERQLDNLRKIVETFGRG